MKRLIEYKVSNTIDSDLSESPSESVQRGCPQFGVPFAVVPGGTFSLRDTRMI